MAWRLGKWGMLDSTAQCPATYPSTGFSPFALMYGRPPLKADVPHLSAFDPTSYQFQLRSRLAEFQDLVEEHLIQAAHRQKIQYDRTTKPQCFQVGDGVWLSCPTAGKLDPRWEGRWKITATKGTTTYVIHDGQRTKSVHVNRLRKRIQPDPFTPQSQDSTPSHWQPPTVHHDEVLVEETQTIRYPRRTRGPPDRLRY